MTGLAKVFGLVSSSAQLPDLRLGSGIIAGQSTGGVTFKSLDFC